MTQTTILRAYKVELAPTAEQRRHLERGAGIARFAYNWALAEWRRWYRWSKHRDRARRLLAFLGSRLDADAHYPGRPNAYALHAQLTQLKRTEFPWMREVTAYAVSAAVQDVGKAYDHFFRRLKEGATGRDAGKPRFRRRDHECSWHADQGGAIRTERHPSGDRIYLAGLGWVRCKRGGYLPSARFDAAAESTSEKRKTGAWVGDAELCGVGFSRRAGKWYAAVRARVAAPTYPPRLPGLRTGVEVGVRSLAVTNSGHVFGAVRDLESIQRAERLLKLWQRRAARRYIKGREQSRSWHAAQQQVRKYYALLAGCRADLLHKTSRALVELRAETFVMRDMQVKNMIRRDNKRTDEEIRTRNALAPMVSKVGMYELRRQVEYKQAWAGGSVVVAPSDHATTRTCSACGVVRATEPPYPAWTCEDCGARHDRERNAALNLANYSPPSGGDAASGGTRPRKTRKGTTGKRTGKPVATTRVVTDGPDGDETSALGSANPALASASGKRAVRRHATEMGVGNGARHAPDRVDVASERFSDAKGLMLENATSTNANSDLSQSVAQASEIVGGAA